MQETHEAGSTLRSGRSPGERNGNPLQSSCLGNSTDRGACQTAIHGVAESDTAEWLSTNWKRNGLAIYLLLFYIRSNTGYVIFLKILFQSCFATSYSESVLHNPYPPPNLKNTCFNINCISVNADYFSLF